MLYRELITLCSEIGTKHKKRKMLTKRRIFRRLRNVAKSDS